MVSQWNSHVLPGRETRLRSRAPSSSRGLYHSSPLAVLSGIVLLLFVAIAGAADAGIAISKQMQRAPDHAGKGQSTDSKKLNHILFLSQAPLKRPAKPMKAMERMPAMKKLIAVPRTSAGRSKVSVSSRSPAIKTSARVNPTPAPSA